jgi:hypothetical protein
MKILKQSLKKLCDFLKQEPVVGYQEHGIVYPSFILVKGRKTF